MDIHLKVTSLAVLNAPSMYKTNKTDDRDSGPASLLTAEQQPQELRQPRQDVSRGGELRRRCFVWQPRMCCSCWRR